MTRAVRSFTAALGLAGLAACVMPTPREGDPPHPPDPTKPAKPADRAPDDGHRLDPDHARAEAARILEEVAAARNLGLLRTVKVDVIDKAGIRSFAKQAMYEHTTPAELQMFGRIEASFGVIPAGSDPERILLDMLEDGVLGLYDPKRKTLFIGDFIPAGTLSMVVGHEIAHGLQDMHFDLAKHQQPILHDSDAESARTFLIEGEAQAAYLAWVSGPEGLAAIDDAVLDAMGNQTLDLAKLASPYPALARSLQLPYTDGTATVIRLVRTKGWKAVDALYADLPQTSEQMLHLDKLEAREPARKVQIKSEPLQKVSGLTAVWHDNIGEAELLAMVADVDPSIRARAATDGWGGDRYVAFDDKAHPREVPLVVAAIAWDTVEDAQEFEEAFARYLEHAVPKSHTIARRGDVVLVCAGVLRDDDPEAIAATAWESVRVDGKAPSAKAGSR